MTAGAERKHAGFLGGSTKSLRSGRPKSERNRNFRRILILRWGTRRRQFFFLTKDHWTIRATQNSHFNHCRGLEVIAGRVPVSPIQQTIAGTRFQDSPPCEVHRHHLISCLWCSTPGNALIGTSADVLTFTLQRATLAAPSWWRTMYDWTRRVPADRGSGAWLLPG